MSRTQKRNSKSGTRKNYGGKKSLTKRDKSLLLRRVNSDYNTHPKINKIVSFARAVKFSPSYLGEYTGTKFTGKDKEYDQAIDKVQAYVKDGARG